MLTPQTLDAEQALLPPVLVVLMLVLDALAPYPANITMVLPLPLIETGLLY